jgi:hypothetical protein
LNLSLCVVLTVNITCYFIPQARDLDIDAKPRSEGPSRFSFQKLSTKETAARAKESVVRTRALDCI